MVGFASTFWWSPRSTSPEPASAPEANAAAPQFPEEERRQFEQSYSRVIWGPGIPAESPEGLAAVLVAGRYQNWQSARERLALLGLSWDEFVGDRLERETSETGVLQLGLHSDLADPTRLRAFVAQERSSTPPGQRFTASLELPDPGEWYLTPTGHLMNPGIPEGPVVRLALNEPNWPIPEWSFEILSDGSFRVELASKPGWCSRMSPPMPLSTTNGARGCAWQWRTGTGLLPPGACTNTRTLRLRWSMGNCTVCS